MKLLTALALASLLSACTTFAAPPPMATLGGPTDVPRAGEHQGTLAAGYGGLGLGNSDDDGYGGLARWRYGLSDQTNIGVDALGYWHEDENGLTTKFEVGHLVGPNVRLDFGLGVGDDEHGKSINADAGVVFGLNEPRERGWNWYGALRLGGGLGFDDDFNRDTQPGDEKRPRDSLLPMGSLGTTVRLSPGVELVIEAGYGWLVREGVDDTTESFYLTSGLIFGSH